MVHSDRLFLVVRVLDGPVGLVPFDVVLEFATLRHEERFEELLSDRNALGTHFIVVLSRLPSFFLLVLLSVLFAPFFSKYS